MLDRTRSLVDGALGYTRNGGHVGWEPGMTAASRVVAELVPQIRSASCKPLVSGLQSGQTL